MPRKKADVFYIYKTTCTITGRYYIGMHATANIDDGYLGSGLKLRHSIRKYGKENHIREILEYCDSREQLVKRETEIVHTELIADVMCMNLREGGTGGFTPEQQRLNVIKSNEKQKLLRLTNNEWVEKYKENKSKSAKKVFLEKGSDKSWIKSWSGKTHTDETIIKMKQVKVGHGVGETNSQHGTCWITKDGTNKKIKLEALHTYVVEGWIKGRNTNYGRS